MQRSGFCAVGVCVGLALSSVGCAPARESAAIHAEPILATDLVQIIRVRPAQPTVGDTLWLNVVLANHGTAGQRITLHCAGSSFREQLPIARPPSDTSAFAREIRELGLEFQCLGIEVRTLLPGDSIVVADRSWGPLLEPGNYSISLIPGYSPRNTAVDVHVSVLPRRR
jgi:hypothetical protein